MNRAVVECYSRNSPTWRRYQVKETEDRAKKRGEWRSIEPGRQPSVASRFTRASLGGADVWRLPKPRKIATNARQHPYSREIGEYGGMASMTETTLQNHLHSLVRAPRA